MLYVRNFLIRTTPDTIKTVFEAAINNKIERIKKIYDYAFIHFHDRDHAELAMRKLQSAEIDGSNIEIRWAKPVDRELYRIQKQSRGNAKFNNSYDLTQTLLLYKQHLDKKEYANSPKEDEGIGSAYGGSPCGSPTDIKTIFPQACSYESYMLAPAKLDSVCKRCVFFFTLLLTLDVSFLIPCFIYRYMWAPPAYEYQKFVDPRGSEVWVGKVELPQVGLPLLSVPKPIGPLMTTACYSMQQAQVEAAETALKAIQVC